MRQEKLLAKPPTLQVIFQTGDRILSCDGRLLRHRQSAHAASRGARQRHDRLPRPRASRAGVLAEGAGSGGVSGPVRLLRAGRDPPDPTSALHSFKAGSLWSPRPIGANWIAALPIGASAADVDAAHWTPRPRAVRHALGPAGRQGREDHPNTYGSFPCRTLLRHRRAPCARRPRQPGTPGQRETAADRPRPRALKWSMEALATDIGALILARPASAPGKLDFDQRCAPGYLAPFRAWRA